MTRDTELVLSHPVVPMGHVVHCGAPGHEMSSTIFMLGWDQCGFHKKHARTRYAKLMFWHPEGFAGNVMYSAASGPLNIDSLFFTLGKAQCGCHKKHARIRYFELVLLHTMGSVGHVWHFGASRT
jgi:hypothetical protein